MTHPQILIHQMSFNLPTGVTKNIYLGTERINYMNQHAYQLHPELSILKNFLHLNPDANENDARAALAKFFLKIERIIDAPFTN